MKESGPKAGAKGIVEDLKGKAKEVAGNVTGDDEMSKEGKAQQDKAREERDVAKHEAEADAARGRAAKDEARQRAHQDD